MRYLLGIDLGTSGLKAVIYDLEGRPQGRGYAANEYLPGPAGWAEQEPRAWWAGCCLAIQEALHESGVDPAGIAGVGVCGFHHCPVLVDLEGEPVRPAIVTHDSRLGESLDRLRQAGTLDEVARLAGSQVMTGHFPPIYDSLWHDDRERLEKARWILLAKDFLRFKLIGEIGTEQCDASGTHLVEMPGDGWSDRLCSLLQVPREKLPPIGASSELSGAVTGRAAAETGLRAGTPVVYGGGDSHCALVGLGVIGSGEAGLLLGTNSTLRVSFFRFVPELEDSIWAQLHVVPGRYTVSASSMAGSSVLGWFRQTMGQRAVEGGTPLSHGGPASFEEMEAEAAGVPPGSDGLLFHPYLYGERSPFCNPHARGAFVGLAHWHGRAHMVRAVLEGVAYSVADCFETVCSVGRRRGEEIRCVRTPKSGGIRLRLWRRILADSIGFPLEIVDVEEAGCQGAALLAGVGVGEHADLSSALARAVRVSSVVQPEAEAQAAYRGARERFRDAYRALEPVLYAG